MATSCSCLSCATDLMRRVPVGTAGSRRGSGAAGNPGPPTAGIYHPHRSCCKAPAGGWRWRRAAVPERGRPVGGPFGPAGPGPAGSRAARSGRFRGRLEPPAPAGPTPVESLHQPSEIRPGLRTVQATDTAGPPIVGFLHRGEDRRPRVPRRAGNLHPVSGDRPARAARAGRSVGYVRGVQAPGPNPYPRPDRCGVGSPVDGRHGRPYAAPRRNRRWCPLRRTASESPIRADGPWTGSTGRDLSCAPQEAGWTWSPGSRRPSRRP